jgi:Holliday junction resolvasome RuvABC endonuclease subunit
MMRILAIDPGTKHIGVALLENEELIDYGVKTIRDRRTAQTILHQASHIVTDLIQAHKPDFFAIERMFVIQKSAALLSVVAEEMKTTARAIGLQVYEYSPSAVRKFLCDSGRATKANVAAVVTEKFPELSRHLQKKHKWETDYYANIFDAIAVGLRCLSELRNQPLPFSHS